MKKLTILVLLALFPVSLRGQNTGTGLPPFGSFTSGGIDTVNNQNLNVYLGIPVASSSGRGLPLNLSLVNNSLVWNKASSWTPVTDSLGNPTWGWQKDFPAGGMASYTSNTQNVKCPTTLQIVPVTFYSNYAYTDAVGTRHTFNSISFRVSALCAQQNFGTYVAYADDATGYYMDASGARHTAPRVTGPGGTQVANGTSTAVDSNGNYVTKTINSGNSSETDWTDSVGNLALKIIYIPNITSPTSVSYQFLDGTATNGVPNYQTITLKLQNLSIKTNFGCGVGEYTGTATVPQELDIPTPAGGTLKYLFAYEPTPGPTGYYTGRVQKVTLPTGGFYEWDYPGANDSVNCSDGTTLTMNRVVSDGTNSATWNFARNTTNSTTTVTTPQLADTPNANDMVYSFDSFGRETSRKVYKESPGVNVLRTMNTTWATNGTPATQVTILEDNATKSELDTTYDSNGLLDSLTEYDWGTGVHGSTAPIRTSAFTYQTSTNYTSRNIINLVTSKTVRDGSNATQYRQDITYDGVALANCPTGVPQHDDTGHGCSMNYRGNPTSVTTYLTPATPANGITKNFTYDWFGNLLTAQLNCCQNKTWTYSATTQYSAPDSVTRGSSPTQLTTSATYNAYTGQVATSTDENNQITNYYYDFLRRPTSVLRQADSATITNTYDDIHFSATTKTPIDSAKSVQQVSAKDGLGRIITSTTEDGSSNVISVVSAQYDILGRAYKTSNPYTGSPSYWTTTQFDVLGRPISVTLPDTSVTTYSYATNTAIVTDPSLKKRKSQSDAAGRLTIAFEPDINNGNQLTQQTSYTYTVLDALATVTQGSQSRTYNYDALGRLTSANTPESGNICFGTVSGSTCNSDGYDLFDNLKYRTDARGVLTTYGYDTLNRRQSISYNVGSSGASATASVGYTYGIDTSCNSSHGAGCIGHLITMTDGVGSENYTYNNLGQMTQLQKVISGTTYSTTYGYNTASELTQITYPSLRVVQQSVDAIGRPCEIAPTTSGCGTASSPYATGYTYNVASQATGLKYGNGIYAAFGFSSDRLQLNCLDYSTTNRNGNCSHDSTTKFGLSYSYGATGSNNGQIAGITDSVDNGRSATYTYDPLYRLSIAATAGSTSFPAWGLQESYDRYGNRSAQAVYSGCVLPMTCPTNSVTPDMATNRISGDCYDNNGNLLAESAPPCPSPTYTYDAENRMVNYMSANPTYVYDGSGLRVKKCLPDCTSPTSSTVYIFSGSKVIAEYDNGALVGSPSREYIYSGGALIARIDSSGTKYYHQDHLSNRLVTDSSGSTFAQLGHFPFGESWYNASNDKLLFTTYERDSESGNDDALARYYVNRMGRFLSSDPLSGSIADPQSLNHYPYAENDSIDNVDPSGECIPPWAARTGINGHAVCTSHGHVEGFLVDLFFVPDYFFVTDISVEGSLIGDWFFGVINTYRPTAAYYYPGGGGGGKSGGASMKDVFKNCRGVTPADFDYNKRQPYKGEGMVSAEDHITQGHISPGTAETVYAFFSIPTASTQEKFEAVKAYNAETFTNPDAVLQQPGSHNLVFIKTFPVGQNPFAPGLPAYIGAYQNPALGLYIPLSTNMLVMNPDCRTPRTSFTIAP